MDALPLNSMGEVGCVLSTAMQEAFLLLLFPFAFFHWRLVLSPERALTRLVFRLYLDISPALGFFRAEK